MSREGAGRAWLVCATAALGCAHGCSSEEPRIGAWQGALAAYCTIQLGKDTGVFKEMESDYVPHVLSCEHPSAEPEALKALAVVARSMGYYKMDRYGWTQDGTSAQVYTCQLKLEQKHIDAALATAGQVLRYNGVNIWGCHVAGAKPSDPQSCVAKPTDPDSTPPTEWAVTYNWDRTGADVEQSGLGLIDPTNDYNRGCFSQNGSDCVARMPKSYKEILRFYFGADIEIATAQGDCVPPTPDGGAHAGDGGAASSDFGGGTDSAALSDRGAQTRDARGAQDAQPEPRGDGGGCATAPRAGTDPVLALGLLLLFSLRPRRRR